MLQRTHLLAAGIMVLCGLLGYAAANSKVSSLLPTRAVARTGASCPAGETSPSCCCPVGTDRGQRPESPAARR